MRCAGSSACSFLPFTSLLSSFFPSSIVTAYGHVWDRTHLRYHGAAKADGLGWVKVGWLVESIPFLPLHHFEARASFLSLTDTPSGGYGNEHDSSSSFFSILAFSSHSSSDWQFQLCPLINVLLCITACFILALLSHLLFGLFATKAWKR